MMYGNYIFMVFVLLWLQNFGYTERPIRKSLKKLSSSNSSHRQEQEHICIFDCEFIIPFGSPLIVPENCTQQSTVNACEIHTKIELSLNFTKFSFPQNTISLIIENERIDNFAVDLVDFYFEENLIAYTLAYQCSYGDMCEWNYIQTKLPTIINRNYQTLYNSLLPLIYNDQPQSNVTHCYSLDEPIDCQSGVCDFTQTLDEETLQLVSIRECLIFDRPKIFFGQYRYSPDPLKYNHDYLYFACNINECNSPENELAIKRAINSSMMENAATKNKGYLYIVLSLCCVFSFLFKNSYLV
ncbi:hypothetical protein I4U23_019288 [Adineta vaga]|nr:hypothetical protein I4U23_019288 [Adineta vaga]